jgi:hypothetical protein
MSEMKYPHLKPGIRVESADHKPIGEVLEVFRDVGMVESFGAVGILPYEEGHDPQRYAFSEAMPGAGDDYFTMRETKGGVLYIPFSAISEVHGDVMSLAVDADSIPDMNWKVRPDALKAVAHEYPMDEGGEPQVA